MNVTRYKCSALAVDDDPAILAILTGQLGGDFDVITACSAEQARAILSKRSVDIVLSDLQLPDETGLSLLDWVRRTAPRTARVLITGTARMQDAVDAINHSQVHRLVLKPWRSEDLIQTLRAISRGLLLERSHEHLLDELRKLNLELEQRVQTRTQELEHALGQLQQANAILERMAATDPLTGLANRRAIDAIARKELQRRTRLPGPIAVLWIDADHFGRVNKDYSQIAGDQVLVWLAGILQSSIRTTDSLGRVGGEEFMVLAPGTDVDGAEVLAERLRTSVEAAQTVYLGNTIRMTVSIGVAVAEASTSAGYEQLREVAAQSLKEAKESGRNRAVIRLILPPMAP
ncbi:diguanylate cyclase [Gemmata sp. G18]|uniref:diguanylate cyclase n=1 Tax=Gemmata palustris TaxID=2822762 RepID=A0ABS5BUU3_9BACT|nr:diguanylate cyclase [Gemmata palustris]MBP3957494.1 diguanylate cyclase [Gemmata palustris]